jgi:hypothetical protein
LSTSIVSNPGFSGGGIKGLTIDSYTNLLATMGVSTSNWWPLEENSSLGLYKLDKNGNWLHKLYIGGANFLNQRVYLLQMAIIYC